MSSATIRNEMAALEELGYLTHPHTSAGRIPTDTGYRHYVDSLPAGGRLRDAQRRLIAGYFAEAIVDLEEVLKGSVQLLSRLTQYAGLAVPPSAVEEPIVRVELIDMGPTLMILAVGQHGRVDKQVIDKPEGVDAAALRDADRRLQGAPGPQLPRRAGAAAAARGRGRRRRSATCCCTSPRRCGSRPRASARRTWWSAACRTSPTRPQQMRRETLRRLFETLEREQEMLGVLADVSPEHRELNVTIGAEHPVDRRVGSLARSRRRSAPGDTTLGTIGVVGPTRMDYLSAMASVRAVAKRLSELATELDQ